MENSWKLLLVLLLCWCLAATKMENKEEDDDSSYKKRQQEPFFDGSAVDIVDYGAPSVVDYGAAAVADYGNGAAVAYGDGAVAYGDGAVVSADGAPDYGGAVYIDIQSSLIDTSSSTYLFDYQTIETSTLIGASYSSSDIVQYFQRAACNPACDSYANIACNNFIGYSSTSRFDYVLNGITYTSAYYFASSCTTSSTCTTTTCTGTSEVGSCGLTCTTDLSTISILYTYRTIRETYENSVGSDITSYTTSTVIGTSARTVIEDLNPTTCTCDAIVRPTFYITSTDNSEINPTRVAFVAVPVIVAAAVLGAVSIWAIVRAAQNANFQQQQQQLQQQQQQQQLIDLQRSRFDPNNIWNQQFPVGDQLITNRLDFDDFPFLRTPINSLSIPVTGSNFTNFCGCGDNSVWMTDGKCYPLLRQGPCSNPRYWLTIDPKSLKVRFFFLLILLNY